MLPPTDFDWPAAAAEAAQVLSGYLQVDTTNPPGNEEAGADYLAAVLARDGIASEKLVHSAGRASLIARLPGTGTEAPLCLLSHIDVVTAEPSHWDADKGPLSGFIDADGTIWGRGALDMKGLGVVETLTLSWLKRLGAPLTRDVVLLAVADEEAGNTGMREVIEKKWPGCSQVLNEGGLGVKDLFFEGQTVYGISVAEKGLLWVRMVASGAAGHGSVPNPESAPSRLSRAVEALREWDPKPTYHSSLVSLLHNVGLSRKGLVRYALMHPKMVTSRFMSQNAGRALLTDTIHVTGFNGGFAPNVVPSEVSANLDCRLLPGTTPEQMLANLRALVPDPNIRFEVLDQSLANESPVDDPFYRALERRSVEGRTDAVAGPALSVGFTDSLLLRPLGVHAYGLAPFEVTIDEALTQHGHRERVSTKNLGDGLRIVLGAVLDVATSSSAAPAPAPPPAPPPT